MQLDGTATTTNATALADVVLILAVAIAFGGIVWLLSRISGTGPRSAVLARVLSPLTSTIRASNDERDAVIGVLDRAWQQGRLFDDEYDRRRRNAVKAATRGQLAGLLSDLPIGEGYRMHEGRGRPRDVA